MTGLESIKTRIGAPTSSPGWCAPAGGTSVPEHAVVVVGGGAKGLVLAVELALAGVYPVIVEWRPDQELVGSRTGGLHREELAE